MTKKSELTREQKAVCEYFGLPYDMWSQQLHDTLGGSIAVLGVRWRDLVNTIKQLFK